MRFFWTLLTITLFLFNPFIANADGRIFVTNERSNTISVINAKSLTIESTIEIGERPRGIGLSPDNTELYVAVSEENKIVVVEESRCFAEVKLMCVKEVVVLLK